LWKCNWYYYCWTVYQRKLKSRGHVKNIRIDCCQPYYIIYVCYNDNPNPTTGIKLNFIPVLRGIMWNLKELYKKLKNSFLSRLFKTWKLVILLIKLDVLKNTTLTFYFNSILFQPSGHCYIFRKSNSECIIIIVMDILCTKCYSV